MTQELSDILDEKDSEFRLHIHSDVDTDLAIILNYNPLIVNARTGSILAGLILLIFYALLVWELFERTFVAMVCSILSVTALACFNGGLLHLLVIFINLYYGRSPQHGRDYPMDGHGATHSTLLHDAAHFNTDGNRRFRLPSCILFRDFGWQDLAHDI